MSKETDIHVFHHFPEGIPMPTNADLDAKLAALAAAVTANGDRTAKEIADLQAALDAAKNAQPVTQAELDAIQTAIDALNVGAPAA